MDWQLLKDSLSWSYYFDNMSKKGKDILVTGHGM
jgi:hypothetical protein